MRSSWFVIPLLVAACGGSATTSPGSGGGNCTLSAGTYVEHFAPEATSTSCPAIGDVRFTLNAPGVITTGGSSSSADGGVNCTTSQDNSTCTFNEDCVTNLSGISSDAKATLTIANDSGSGKETIVTTVSGKTTTCVYDITITKT